MRHLKRHLREGLDSFTQLQEELRDLDRRIQEIDQKISLIHEESEASQRLAEIPGVGKIISTAISSAVGDPKTFLSGGLREEKSDDGTSGRTGTSKIRKGSG